MTADYATLLADQAIQVVEQEGTIQALMVLFERRDHLFIENIAVLPDAQGAGLGSALLRLAEGRAREAALPEVRFYTNEAMTENIGYYERRGYEISGREEEDGFGRVYFRKRVG